MNEKAAVLLGFLFAASVVPVLRKYSSRLGYLDTPGGPLKIHSLPVPRSGGLAIAAVFSCIFLYAWFRAGIEGTSRIAGLVAGGWLVAMIGLWDDLKSLNPSWRLAGEVLAGLILVLAGQRLGGPLFIALPLTLFYVGGAINAVNMEDGLDGLAGGMVILSCLGFACLALRSGMQPEYAATVILAGVLAGFLIYNFHPASIFMGDCGSYFLGFFLAYLAIGFTRLDEWNRFLGPILIIGAPVFDAAYAVLRRWKRGRSLFRGDRDHFYDHLIKKGFTVRKTVLICWGIQAVLVSLGVAAYFWE